MRIEYGPLDLPIAWVDRAGNHTEFGYDTEFRLTTITNPAGAVWRYTYDAAGRLVEETDFDGRTQWYQHDTAGRLIERRNSAGEAASYTWDERGRVTERRIGEVVTRLEYDADGRVAAVVSPDATVRFERDEKGRVVAETINGRTVHTAYDGDRDTVAARTTPSGRSSRWSFDAEGRPLSVATGNHLVRFKLDATGREIARTVDNIVALRQGFDAAGRLAGQWITDRAERHFRYDATGRVTAIADSLGGERSFAADELGQIHTVAVDGAVRERYEYDEVGNLVGAGGDHWQLDGTMLVRSDEATFEYDKKGRLICRVDPAGTWRFAWDAEDRLIEATTPGGDRWRYRYDGFGRRIAKLRLGAEDAILEELDFAWSGDLLVEQSHRDADGTTTTSWEYRPDGSALVIQTDGDAVRAVVTDLIGTPTHLVAADGSLHWRSRSDLWGRGRDAAGSATPLRFPGQYFDVETGLHYNRFRYYDPTTARYLSSDPLGLTGGPNPTAYVSDPLTVADPLGLTSCKPDQPSLNPTDPVNRDASTGQPSYPGAQAGPPSMVAPHNGARQVLVPGSDGRYSAADSHQVPRPDPPSRRTPTGSTASFAIYWQSTGSRAPKSTLADAGSVESATLRSVQGSLPPLSGTSPQTGPSERSEHVDEPAIGRPGNSQRHRSARNDRQNPDSTNPTIPRTGHPAGAALPAAENPPPAQDPIPAAPEATFAEYGNVFVADVDRSGPVPRPRIRTTDNPFGVAGSKFVEELPETAAIREEIAAAQRGTAAVVPEATTAVLDSARQTLNAPVPDPLGVASVRIRTGADGRTFVQQVDTMFTEDKPISSRLRRKPTNAADASQIDIPGQQTLSEFLDASSIAATLPRMVVTDPSNRHDGWIRSTARPRVPKSGWRRFFPHSGRRLEMRLVARQIGAVDVREEATGKRTDTPKEPVVVHYRAVYDVQIRQRGGTPVTLDGSVETDQWTSLDRLPGTVLDPDRAIDDSHRGTGERANTHIRLLTRQAERSEEIRSEHKAQRSRLTYRQLGERVTLVQHRSAENRTTRKFVAKVRRDRTMHTAARQGAAKATIDLQARHRTDLRELKKRHAEQAAQLREQQRTEWTRLLAHQRRERDLYHEAWRQKDGAVTMDQPTMENTQAFVHGGDKIMVGLSEPIEVHPAVSGIGVPKAGLPHLAQIKEMVRDLCVANGVKITSDRLAALDKELLDNYPQLTGGTLIDFGGAEALMSIDPQDPWKAVYTSTTFDEATGALKTDSGKEDGNGKEPSSEQTSGEGVRPDEQAAPAGQKIGLRGIETVNNRFRTGAHSTTHSGTMSATNANVTLSGGLGIGPGVAQVAKVSVGLNATMNKVSNSITTVEDAEIGMVQNTRDTSTLLGYVPNWKMKFRTDPAMRWQDLPEYVINGPSHERLLLWVDDHNLGPAPTDPVTVQTPPAGSSAGPVPLAPEKPMSPKPVLPADPQPDQVVRHESDLRAWEDAQRQYHKQLGQYYFDLHKHAEHVDLLANHSVRQETLPDMLYASGLTSLPEFFDNIAAELRASGLALPIGSPLRTQLRQKLSNLDTNLKKAVNGEDGYRITIANEQAKLAEITVHTTRGTFAEQVGETAKKAHLEDVRTAIEGMSGNQSVSQETKVTVAGGADLLPTLLVKASANLYGSMSGQNSTSFAAGRTGLWVLVDRYAGYTNGYRVGLTHTATVSVSGNPDAAPRAVPAVHGYGNLRMSEPDAFNHGFPVTKEALTDPDNTLPGPNTIRQSPVKPDDPVAAPLPLHVLPGNGLGEAIVKVDKSAVKAIKERLEAELRRTGFLAPDKRRPFFGSRTKRVSRVDNADLLDKLVCDTSFDCHYDPIHQDGMQFTLTLRHKSGRTSHARITIKGDQNLHDHQDEEGNRYSEYHVRRTDEHHIVNLPMRMDMVTSGAGGGKRAAVGFKAVAGYHGDAPRFKWLRGIGGSMEYFRSLNANDAVTYLTNLPELKESNETDIFRLPSDYMVTVEYSDDDFTMPQPIEVKDAQATVHLAPELNNPAKSGSDEVAQPTPEDFKDVLDQAVVLFVNSSGVTGALREVLPDLHGPGKVNDEAIAKFGGNILIRTHIKDVIAGEYTTDHLFDPGFWRDGSAAATVSATMQSSRFAGSTADKSVLGKIKLLLAQATQTTSRSQGVSVSLPSFLGGGPAAQALDMSGSASGTLSWGWVKSVFSGRTGGKELLEIDLQRAYAFSTKLDFSVSAVHEKHGKLAWSSIRKNHPNSLTGKEMVYLLAERDALAAYAKDKLPIPDAHLINALNRWQKGELELSGNIVAGMIARRAKDRVLHVPGPAGDDLIPRAEDGTWPAEERTLDDWATLVNTKYKAGKIFVTGDAAARFNSMFPASAVALADGVNPYANVWIPPYMLRTGSKGVGHSGIERVSLDADPKRGVSADSTPFTLVHDMVERAAPGLLGKRPDVWLAQKGAVVGRLQGGIDGLQALLSGGRDQSLVEDMLHKEGFTLVLTNRVGWVLHDVVQVNLKYRMTSRPEANDLVTDAALGNYMQAHVTHGHGKGQHFQYSASAGLAPRESFGHHNPSDDKNDLSNGNLSHGGSAKIAGGSHRTVNRDRTETTEKIIFETKGDYRAEVRHRLDADVRRVDMAGRPFNNLGTAIYRSLAGHAEPVQESFAGTTVLKIPRSIGDARPLAGPHRPDYQPLPTWVGDGYLSAVLVDDASAVARKLLASLVGRKADDPAFLSSLSLPVELSRTHLQGHLQEALGGKKYRLGDDFFLPGHSNERVRMEMTGDLYDLDVIAPIAIEGPGVYRKTQDGTTFAHSADSPRAGWAFGADGGGAAHIGDTAHQTDPWNSDTVNGAAGTGADHTHNDAGSHAENVRREQLSKPQANAEAGTTYLVRMRGKFRLAARAVTANLVLHETPGDWAWSDPFSGDIYAKLTADQIDQLRSRAENPTAAAADSDTWPAPHAGTPRRDLIKLLDSAGHDGYDQFEVAGEVAQRLRADVGGGPRQPAGQAPSGLVLTSREGQAIVCTYEATLNWAQRELAALGAKAQLAAVRRQLRLLPDLRSLADAHPHRATVRRLIKAKKETTNVINQVTALHGSGWTDALARLRLPPVGLDPVSVGEQIAHELETYLDVVHTAVDGRTTRHRINPQGQAVRLDSADDRKTTLAAHINQQALDTASARMNPVTHSIKVPADGRCQLYAMVASNPALVGSKLSDAGLGSTALHAWLKNPARVRAQLSALALHPRRNADGLVPSYLELAQAAEHLRTLIDRNLHDVGAAGVPHDAVRHFRTNNATRLRAEIDNLTRDELIDRMELTDPGFRTDDELRGMAMERYLDDTRPLDDIEFAQIVDAVGRWERMWSADVGETFLPLIAHALDARIKVHRPRLGPIAVGREDSPLIQAFRTGAHYDGVGATSTPVVSSPATKITATRTGWPKEVTAKPVKVTSDPVPSGVIHDVPAEGRRQLYSVLAADPALIRDRFDAAGVNTTSLRDWLGSPQRIRDDLATWRGNDIRNDRGVVSVHTDLGRAAEQLRQLVEDHLRTLGTNHLPAQVVAEIRNSAIATVRAGITDADRATLLQQLHGYGVTRAESGASVPLSQLREVYLKERTADLIASGKTEVGAPVLAMREVRSNGRGGMHHTSLSAQQMFEYLAGRGVHFELDQFGDDTLREIAADRYLDVRRPLTEKEFADLVAAVRNWEHASTTPLGEAFLPLLADTLNVQFRVHQPGLPPLFVGRPGAEFVDVVRHGDHYMAVERTSPPAPVAPPAVMWGRSLPAPATGAGAGLASKINNVPRSLARRLSMAFTPRADGTLDFHKRLQTWSKVKNFEPRTMRLTSSGEAAGLPPTPAGRGLERPAQPGSGHAK